MPIDSAFLRAAQTAFDPYVLASGTEHVAFLLYSLVRMTRPRSVVEYGSGYTTLFLLRALMDNTRDADEERASLLAKTAAAGGAAALDAAWDDPRVAQWLGDGGKACGVDPAWYLETYRPRLYSFEDQDDAHEYAARMKNAVQSLELADALVHIKGRRPSPELLPARAYPIDLAWNDHRDYREFFDSFWPHLHPRGGLMLFHNTTAVAASWDDVQWMKARRAEAGDLEILTLQEPHKLSQNSCTILRRVSAALPRFLTKDSATGILSALRALDDAKPRAR
jgi:predicted O-methyltransferase YrrM